MIDLTNVDTERRNINTFNLDEMSPLEIVKIMNEEDGKIAEAISKILNKVATVVEIGGQTLHKKGRIIYIGAGTSGRLGILDAVECPPTFGVDFNQVRGIIAGGEQAFIKAVEGAEDSKDLCIQDLKAINFNKDDLLLGIAASGRTPYVIGGLEYATQVGAKTSSLAITRNSEIAKYAQYPIELEVGAEVLTGSTRLKAGTAQKMILNMISTGSMILNGKVYQNLMVDVQQTNEKLVERARGIVIEATGCDYETATLNLELASGSAKVAIVMILTNSTVKEANVLLEKGNGFIKKAII